MANSGTAGYMGGGYDTSNIDSIEKLTFSTDGIATLTATLSVGVYAPAGFANSGVSGYYAGGSGSVLATVDELAFSDDSRTTLSTGLATATRYCAGFANSESL